MNKNKTKILLVVSLLSLAPTMVHAEKLAGYLWAGTALGAGVGAVFSGVATGLSEIIRRSGRKSVQLGQEVRKGKHDKKIISDDLDPILHDALRSGVAADLKKKGEIREDIGSLGVLTGGAVTIAMTPLFILSLYQAVKNFKDSD